MQPLRHSQGTKVCTVWDPMCCKRYWIPQSAHFCTLTVS